MSGTKKLRAGLIGCGVGAHHGYAFNHCQDEFELVAICDINAAAFPKFYEKSGIAPGSVREYTDYNDLIANETLDVISVATPDDYHTGPVIASADAGIKGILCEKPLTSSLTDADKIIEAVERNGTKMSVDHTRSWYPQYQATRAAIRGGSIGPVTRISARLGGRRAMLFRNGTHIVDAICFFADAPPVWVIAAHESGFEDYGPNYKGEGGKDPMLDPGSTLIIEYANGTRGVLDIAKYTPAALSVDIIGPSGSYSIPDSGPGAAFTTEKPEAAPTEAPVPWTTRQGDDLGPNLIPALHELYQMVVNDAPSSSPPQRARDVLEILFGALQSQTNGSAKISLPLPRS